MAFAQRTLEIPAPAGFEPVSHELPRYMRSAQDYWPWNNRLVATYVPAADKAALLANQEGQVRRFFQLRVQPGADRVPQDPAKFTEFLDQVEARMTDETKRFNAVGTQTNAQVRLGLPAPLGVYRRESWGLFFTTSNPVVVEVDRRPRKHRLVNASALVQVDGQLLYLFAYADATDPNARAWAEANAATWADAIRAANVARASTDARPDRSVLYAAIALLAMVALVFVVTRRRRA
jgi:hypothetical protein